VRSRPRDLAADSENRLQSARPSARKEASWLALARRSEPTSSASPARRSTERRSLAERKCLEADSRRSRLSNRNEGERFAVDRPDARFATRSGTVPATASADPLRCWRGHHPRQSAARRADRSAGRARPLPDRCRRLAARGQDQRARRLARFGRGNDTRRLMRVAGHAPQPPAANSRRATSRVLTRHQPARGEAEGSHQPHGCALVSGPDRLTSGE
jgi:hypothetical protein